MSVVHFCNLPSRPKQSVMAYYQIRSTEDSPVVVTSYRAQTALQLRVDVPVELAMHRQNPSIEE